jgi:hypothetical protein
MCCKPLISVPLRFDGAPLRCFAQAVWSQRVAPWQSSVQTTGFVAAHAFSFRRCWWPAHRSSMALWAGALVSLTGFKHRGVTLVGMPLASNAEGGGPCF